MDIMSISWSADRRDEDASFAASYLVTSDTLLEVDFSDGQEGEPGSGLRLYNPSKRAALKLRGLEMNDIDHAPTFFVEHLSGLDFSVKLADAVRAPSPVAHLCGLTTKPHAWRRCTVHAVTTAPSSRRVTHAMHAS